MELFVDRQVHQIPKETLEEVTDTSVAEKKQTPILLKCEKKQRIAGMEQMVQKSSRAMKEIENVVGVRVPRIKMESVGESCHTSERPLSASQQDGGRSARRLQGWRGRHRQAHTDTKRHTARRPF